MWSDLPDPKGGERGGGECLNSWSAHTFFIWWWYTSRMYLRIQSDLSWVVLMPSQTLFLLHLPTRGLFRNILQSNPWYFQKSQSDPTILEGWHCLTRQKWILFETPICNKNNSKKHPSFSRIEISSVPQDKHII